MDTFVSVDIEIIFLIDECYNKKIFDFLSINYLFKSQIEKQIDRILKNILELDKLKNIKCVNNCELFKLVNRISGYYDNRIFLLSFEEIIYIRADGDYTDIITKSGMMYKSKLSLKYLTNKLKWTNFYRCHRSFLVNLEKVKEINPSFNYTFELILNNCKDKVPVGRKYMKDFKELVGL